MDRQDLPLDSRHHANRIKDFVDDEKSLGRATKSEIAAAIGIQPSHFSNLLNGRNEWKLTHLQKLAEFLGVPLARLFEERGRNAETTPSGGGTLDSLEENIVRALQAETRTLRSGLREDLAALLRRHITDRQGLTPREFADDDTAAPYTDTPADHSAARPVEIHDLGAEYDKPPGGSLTARESFWFGRDWLRRNEIDSTRCLLVRVRDESMQPALPEGSWILVNRGQRRRREGRIYALRTTRGLIVGRAGRDKARKWLLESDNPAWEPVPWPDDAEVIGEVRWMARTL